MKNDGLARVAVEGKSRKEAGKGGKSGLFLKMLGFYRYRKDYVKIRKNRHEKAPQRPERPLRGANFDTICGCLELL